MCVNIYMSYACVSINDNTKWGAILFSFDLFLWGGGGGDQRDKYSSIMGS